MVLSVQCEPVSDRQGYTPCLCREFPPLGQRSRTVLLEVVAAVKVAVEVEMIVDRGVDGGEFLHGLDVPEPGLRRFVSSERLVGIFGSIGEPPLDRS